MEITKQEELVYGIIYKQCQRICVDTKVNDRLFGSILVMCDIVSLSLHFYEIIDPVELKSVLLSLIEKKMIREFERDNRLSFVPFSYCKIVTYTRHETEIK